MAISGGNVADVNSPDAAPTIMVVWPHIFIPVGKYRDQSGADCKPARDGFLQGVNYFALLFAHDSHIVKYIKRGA